MDPELEQSLQDFEKALTRAHGWAAVAKNRTQYTAPAAGDLGNQQLDHQT